MVKLASAVLVALCAASASAFAPSRSAAARSSTVMMARGKVNKLGKGTQRFTKDGLLIVQGFVVPKDAKCVDDVVGERGSAGTKLNVAAGLREAGRPLPLVLRPELTPEEKEAKQALRKQLQYGNLALILFFMYNLVTTAINNEHPWNYSGNNDAICAAMREKGEDTEALCGEANTKKIRAPYTARPKGVDLANTQKK